MLSYKDKPIKDLQRKPSKSQIFIAVKAYTKGKTDTDGISRKKLNSHSNQ